MANKYKERMAPFIEQVSALRVAKELTLQDFALECGMPYGTMANYLRNGAVPPLSSILKICNAFSVSPNMLLRGLYAETPEFVQLKAISSFMDSSSKLDFVINSMVEGAPHLNKMIWSGRLRILREDTGRSREDVADKCGIDPESLRQYEATQRFPSLFVFLSLCREFNISPAYMLCRELNFSLITEPRLMDMTPRQIAALAATIPQIRK